MHTETLQRLHVPGRGSQLLESVRFVERKFTGLRAAEPAQMRPAAQRLPNFMSHGPAFFDSSAAATGSSRLRRVAHALRTAAPFRSAPEDAALADVLGTLSVVVGITRTRPAGRPSSRIATPWIFVWSPCPISVPPWFTRSEEHT